MGTLMNEFWLVVMEKISYNIHQRLSYPNGVYANNGREDFGCKERYEKELLLDTRLHVIISRLKRWWMKIIRQFRRKLGFIFEKNTNCLLFLEDFNLQF